MPTIISPLPFSFINGTTIDATQVNANEGQIVSNVNTLGTTAGAALVGALTSTNNAGATVQAQLTNVGGTTGSTNVGYTPPGVGSVATTVGAKLATIISVLDFGADPTGATDSTTAIQAAITYANGISYSTGNGGGRPQIKFPQGFYKTNALTNNQSVCFQGDGSKATYILLNTGVTGSMFTINAVNPGFSIYDTDHTEFHGMTLIGNRTDSVTLGSSSAINCPNTSWTMATQYSPSVRMFDVNILGFNNDGLFLGTNRNWALITNCIIRYCTGNGFESYGVDHRVLGCDFGQCTGVGVYFQAGGANTFIGCNIYGNLNNVVASAFHNAPSDFTDCYLDNALHQNVYMGAPTVAGQYNILRIYGGRIYTVAGGAMTPNTWSAVQINAGSPASTHPAEVYLIGVHFLCDAGAPQWKYLVETDATTPRVVMSACQYDNTGGTSTPYATAVTDDFTALQMAGTRDAWWGNQNGAPRSLGAWIYNGTNPVNTEVHDINGFGLLGATTALGYRPGSGGNVVQATNKSTGVTLNAGTGTITMNNAALNAGVTVTFQLTNSVIGAVDLVNVQVVSGVSGFANYQAWAGANAAGSCFIAVRNISGGNLSEAVVLQFAVIKGSSS